MKSLFYILCAALWVQTAMAEVRVWTDVNGRRIKAALVSVTEDAITLRLTNGTKGSILKSTLSPEDQNYLAQLELDAAKSEQKLKAEPVKPRNEVTVSRRKILVNGSQYRIKGVCYNPVPKGSSQRTFDRLAEDLALMVEAGINTIRVYTPIDDRAVLDQLDAVGIKVIMGFGYNQGGHHDIQSGSFIEYVETYKDHGAILFWELGNEYNYHPEWFGGDIKTWYTAMNKAARDLHHYDPSRPVSTAHGELPDKLALSSCPNIDIWGINAYRWDQPGNLFQEWRAISSQPMYLAEAGADRYMTASLNGYDQGENEEAQADATKSILDDTFSAKSICSGVTLFAFVDELWKAGNPNVQDPGGAAPNSGGVPYDGAANEEYWGIVDIERTKKEVFEVVKKKYNSVR